MLNRYYNDDNIQEIGVDEVGRGPMFGRVYTAAVVLPKNSEFKHELIKDSKKFTSKKKLLEIYNYIKSNCIAYSVTYCDEKTIDKSNILASTHSSMHSSIKNINNYKNSRLLVDGNNFKPITYYNENDDSIKQILHICVEKGDNKYTAIAAASILAKVERDQYICDLCALYPKLNDYYDLLNNKGYGTKRHLDGIKQYGITNMHRKTFGICKNSEINEIIN